MLVDKFWLLQFNPEFRRYLKNLYDVVLAIFQWFFFYYLTYILVIVKINQYPWNMRDQLKEFHKIIELKN